MWKIVLSITMVLAVSIAIAAPDGVFADDDDDELTVDVIPDGATLSFVDLNLDGAPTPGEPFIIEWLPRGEA